MKIPKISDPSGQLIVLMFLCNATRTEDSRKREKAGEGQTATWAHDS